MAVFWVVAPCGPVWVNQRHRGLYCLHRQITLMMEAVQTSELSPWRQNPKVHHRIHNSPPTIRILSQVNPLHTPPTKHPKVHFDPILSSTTWSFKWSFSFGLSHQNPVPVSPLSHACHMPHPPSSPWFDLPNNIWWWVRIMKLRIEHGPLKRWSIRTSLHGATSQKTAIFIVTTVSTSSQRTIIPIYIITYLYSVAFPHWIYRLICHVWKSSVWKRLVLS
jgi:hypothetical protein